MPTNQLHQLILALFKEPVQFIVAHNQNVEATLDQKVNAQDMQLMELVILLLLVQCIQIQWQIANYLSELMEHVGVQMVLLEQQIVSLKLVDLELHQLRLLTAVAS